MINVRTIPRSRHDPQFNLEALPKVLASAEIAYQHTPGLGGLRHAHADSPNAGWRSASFRSYADYMQSASIARNIEEVVELAHFQRCVLMCAEAVPWRCHRSTIGDALLTRGVRVEDIIGPHGRTPHVLTSFAHVEGRHVTYPTPVEVDGGLTAERASLKAIGLQISKERA